MPSKVLKSQAPDTVSSVADGRSQKKPRKWRRETLFARKCRSLNKRPATRTAMTPSRVTRLFKEQTAALRESPDNTVVYADELHSVQRISKRSSELLAYVLEKRLSLICKALRDNARHAGRKTVKHEDFRLLLEQAKTSARI